MKRWTVYFVALAMTVVFMGCSRNSEKPETTQKPAPTHSAAMPSDRNDSFEGGGAGGTEDDGINGDHSPKPSGRPGSDEDGLLGDIGDAADDLRDGVGDMMEDAGRSMQK